MMKFRTTIAQRAVIFAIVLIIVLIGIGFYDVFVKGITHGPDFIQALRTQRVTADEIYSIEVCDPPSSRNWPFSEKEYADMKRRTTIDSPDAIRLLISHLATTAQVGYVSQDHPGTSHQLYLKVNTRDGYYWLYGYLLTDQSGPVLMFEANTRNSTNLNGANTYHMEDTSVLALVEK